MLREFVYIDVTRARSLLAQMNRGVVDTVVQRQEAGDTTEIGVSLLGLKAGTSMSGATSVEESRSMQDLTAVVFEEALQETGLLTDLDAEGFSDPAEWESSAVHDRLTEGEIVRYRGDVLVVDPAFLSDRFQRLDAFGEALVTMQVDAAMEALGKLGAATGNSGGQKAGGTSRQQAAQKKLAELKDEMRRETMKTMWGDAGQSVVRNVGRVLSEFLGDGLTLRCLPCGIDRPELSLSGSLLDRDEYIQRERRALLERFGTVWRGFTVLMQIARIPTEVELEDAASRDFSSLNVMFGGHVNRAAMEVGANDMNSMLEAIGLAEGPRWPAIGVIPLAIYRPVPGSTA